MELLNLSITNIKKRRAIYILILLQMTFYIYTVMSFFNLYEFRNEFIKKLDTSITSEGRYYFLPYQSEFYVDEEQSKEDKLELLNFIKSDHRVLGIGSFRTVLLPSYNINNFDKIFESFKVENFQNNNGNVILLKIDYDYFKLMNLSCVKGNIFKKEDFYNDNVIYPIIVGHNFKKYYNLGDELHIDENLKYKIIGFLPKDYTVYLSSTVMNMENANSIIICPEDIQLKDNAGILKEKFFGGIQFVFRNNVDYEKSINDFYKKSNELNIKINFIKFKDNVHHFYNALEPTIKIELFKVIVFFILTLVGVISLLLYLLNIRKKEFGVLICTGIKLGKLLFLILCEWFILILISYFISCVLFINFETSLNGWFKYTYGMHNLGITFIVTVLIFAIASIIPIRKILKVQPRDLIGGI
ncbi:FtsX-like permease family protein [Clostridium rectalis]|uniref:FtsX-like permease family protein n=1 Tax=Clostridium rectalis TaxID=2040295 RepID=UPI000F63D148|nr:ABC transporter permease [Clostridium rectalis]